MAMSSPQRVFHHGGFIVFNLCLIIFPLNGAILEEWPDTFSCQSTSTPMPSTGNVTAKQMPDVPDKYSLMILVNVLQDGWSYQIQEHFDDINHRADMSLTFNGTTARTIFNLDPGEKFEIQPDGSCTTTHDNTDSLEFLTFRVGPDFPKAPKTLITRVFDSFPGKGIYVGQSVVRGVTVDHWTKCLASFVKALHVQADMYFTLPGYNNAWGQGPMPFRVILKGFFRISEFNNVYDIMSFRPGPPEDQNAFSIPNNVVCTGGSSTKVMPNLPDNFQMDIEISSSFIGNSLPLQQSLRYDWTNQLVEIVRDFPSPQGVPGDKTKHKPASILAQDKDKRDQAEIIIVKRYVWTEDYYIGLQYITEKNNNTCSVRPLPSTKMSHGNALLRMSVDQNSGDSKFTYQGVSTFRGLPAESWGMDVDGLVQKVFFLIASKGVNYPKDSMTAEEKDELKNGMSKIMLGTNPKYPIPIGIVLRNRTAIDTRHLPTLLRELISSEVLKEYDGKFMLAADRAGEDPNEVVRQESLAWTRRLDIINEHVGEVDMNVYHFQPLRSDPEMFHVSQCYSPDQISKVILTVKTPYDVNVRHHPTAFSIAIQSSVAKAMGVSPIQISDVALTPVVNKEKNIDVTLVTFNLLGSPPVTETKNKQLSLEDAKKRLVQAIGDGITFSVRYLGTTKSFLVSKDQYLIDYSLKEYSALKNGGPNDSLPEPHKSESRGYSGGVVAAVAIAMIVVTCVITSVLFLAYLKYKKNPNFPSIPYQASKE